MTIMVARIHLNPETLDSFIEFDRPFTITEGGGMTDGPDGVYAPEVYHVEDQREPEVIGEGWSFVDGYSGQFMYSGPVMHPSEYLGGRMAEDVLDTPATYVACVVEVLADDEDPEPEPAGWVLLRAVEPTEER